MKIDNEKLSRLYQEESGKLLLGLNSNRFNQYVQIINNTKSYRQVIDSIPPDLSNLEKTIEKIVRERIDYKKRVKDAEREYKFYEKNKDKIDFMVYTDYSTKADEKVDEIINRILGN